MIRPTRALRTSIMLSAVTLICISLRTQRLALRHSPRIAHLMSVRVRC